MFDDSFSYSYHQKKALAIFEGSASFINVAPLQLEGLHDCVYNRSFPNNSLSPISLPQLFDNTKLGSSDLFKMGTKQQLDSARLTLGPLRCGWLHCKLARTIASIVGIFFIFACSVVWSITHGFSFDKSAPLVFYGSGSVGTYLFLDLSRKWNSFSNRFQTTDLILQDYGLPKGQRRKFRVITVFFVIGALVEHILSLMTVFRRLVPCKENSHDVSDFIHMYFIAAYTQIFSMVNYNIVLGVIIFILNFLSTCCWNLMDLFLGLIGIALSSRLRQFNKALESSFGLDKPTNYWRKVREEFNAISVLIKSVDEDVQKLMLLSLGSNLFFICLQLLKSLNTRINEYQIAYFFWSFGFLILRMCFVTLCAAGIYDESKEAKTVLFSVPYQSFCDEVRRFIVQLSNDDLALTGSRFFSVTRGLILTITGTIVTYEIVLVQFKTDISVDEWPSVENKTLCPNIM